MLTIRERLQRWRDIEMEIAKHRLPRDPIGRSQLPQPDASWRTVSFPRESVLRFRADYEMIVAVLSDILRRDVMELGALELVLAARDFDVSREEAVATERERVLNAIEACLEKQRREEHHHLAADIERAVRRIRETP